MLSTTEPEPHVTRFIVVATNQQPDQIQNSSHPASHRTHHFPEQTSLGNNFAPFDNFVRSTFKQWMFTNVLAQLSPGHQMFGLINSYANVNQVVSSRCAVTKSSPNEVKIVVGFFRNKI